MSAPLLSISAVSKTFGNNYALKDVNLEVKAGECVCLVGENGAGKSTLMKILSGVWPSGSYTGEIRFGGAPLHAKSTLDARRAGISIIHQELCLFPKLTVAENLFLTELAPYDGAPSTDIFRKVDWEAMHGKAKALFAELDFDLDPRATVEELSVAQRQLVEIARAIHHKARLLILDEPTSALSKTEVESLFRIVDRIRETKMAFIYISHKLDEVFRLADRIIVLRDGQTVAELSPKESNEALIIRHMVGRPVLAGERVSYAKPTTTLEVQALSHDNESGKRILDHISFHVKEGEILGIAGLMGSGRSELLRSLIGVLPGNRDGKVFLKGRLVEWQGISEALQDRVAFVPEDRKKDGLFLDHGVDFNLTISVLSKFLNRLRSLDLRKEVETVKTLSRRMRVKCARFTDPIRVLSGGNQQKVLLGKVVASAPRILLLDEPTRGIDVGAKEEIYDIIRSLAAEGISVILVSSELPEILALSDRVIVLREGRLAGSLVNHDLDQERIMSLAAGGAIHASR